MDLATEVRRIVQAFLGERDEDRAWLQGDKGHEWHAAYMRLLEYTCRRMQVRLGWRDFLEVRMRVIAIVRELVSESGRGA